MPTEQFTMIDKKIDTLSLLQSINNRYEYIVEMKENDFTLNFNSLISSNSSSIKETSFSSTNDVKALFPFFFNSDFVKNIIFKNNNNTIVILELCASHFERKIDHYKQYKRKERTLDDLKDSYGDTDILKTFSDSIYEQGYSQTIYLPKFGIESSKKIPCEREFLIQKCDYNKFETNNIENESHFSFKVNIPITHNQIIRLCLDTIQSIKNGCKNNYDEAKNEKNKLFVEKELKKSIENILNLQQYSDKKLKATYFDHLLSLFYYNAALYISNGGLTKENNMLFSATPMNYFALRCYLFTRISYVNPNSYFKELQLFKKLLFDNLKVNNIHRFLIDAWVYRESSHFNHRGEKRPISLYPEENLHFNEYSGPCHLISCSSILEELKNLYTSMNKTEKDLILALSKDSPQDTKRDKEIKSLKSRLQNICSNILLLYLSLVYGISWKTIKKLTLENILDLILGFNNFDEAIDLPHIMGLPSIVLRLLGIQQIQQNTFMNVLCVERKRYKVVFEFGPLGEDIPPSLSDVLIKDNAFSKGIDKVIKERFPHNGIIASILHSLKSTYLQNDLSLLKKKEIFETYLRNEVNKPLIKRDQKGDNEKNGDAADKNCKTNNGPKEFFYKKDSQEAFVRCDPITCFFTIKELNENHYQINNIGDIALTAILSYNKYIDEDFSKICFTQFRMPHFQKLVKDLVIKDYITHGGFNLPGETDSAKRLKRDSKLETVNTEREIEYPITRPHVYDYKYANVGEETNNERVVVDKKFEKNLLNLMTMTYSIDMLRVTSLNFVMRSLSVTISFCERQNQDEGYKKKIFHTLLNSSLDNFNGLSQTILLKMFSPRIYEKELPSFRHNSQKDFLKFFFMKNNIKTDGTQRVSFDINYTRFFIHD
uniref:Uncharacterized protein n=1 Tax=Armadillidium vulgare clopovirus TaxID=2984284 RepID=A0A9C7F8K4_9VIRU|nr:MAG: hypothetical protein [Armadillidium vulgare clopovirus]